MRKEVIKMLPSQCGQDKFLIENIFEEKEGGFFVDVGAHDGIYLSNTAVFEKEYSWKGICIEPSQASSVIISSRPNSRVVVCCVSDEAFSNKIVKFRQCNPREVSMSMFDDDGEYEEKENEYTDKYKICKTLNSILLENNAPKDIDYVSIDTEGCEYRVIKDFPFKEWNVSAVTIANNFHLGTPEKKENGKKIKKLMESSGFYLFRHFTIHELNRKNWGKQYSDGVMEDLYVNKKFIPQKNPH